MWKPACTHHKVERRTDANLQGCHRMGTCFLLHEASRGAYSHLLIPILCFCKEFGCKRRYERNWSAQGRPEASCLSISRRIHPRIPLLDPNPIKLGGDGQRYRCKIFSVNKGLQARRGTSNYLGALGGTLNGDPFSLFGVIWVLPGYIGVYKAYKGLYRVMGLGVPPRGPS